MQKYDIEKWIREEVEKNEEKAGEKNEPALHHAIFKDNMLVFEYLINNGADINKPDESGNTSLHVAVVFNRRGIIKYLLDNMTNVNAVNNWGETALWYAHDLADLKYLVSRGVDPKILNENGKNFLTGILMKENNKIIEFATKELGLEAAEQMMEETIC